MAYKTYTTKALVCGIKNSNTADRSYLLFTREAGMLFASARSVREERSRQRYALQEFSLVRISLVKGKHGWRVGSIESQKNYYHYAFDKAARGSVVSIFRLVRRFVHGEDSEPELFDYLISALDELANDTPQRVFLQMIIQVRILAILGYVDIKLIPEAVRIIPVTAIAEQYSPLVQQQIEKLYTQAVSVSQL